MPSKKTKERELEPVIGLEIHIQLKTKSKMFCACDNTGENQPANTTICPICTGQPGTLPAINRQAVDFALKMALALNCQISEETKFDRKNYFYPDLPKGYQISQYDQPIAKNGHLSIGKHKIRINRAHLEEDAAKLLHSADTKNSLVDFNRAGTPLLEIVTEPDINSSEEAKMFLQELRLLARYLEISDADMEKGHLRCDANISLRPKGDKKLHAKTEVKNLNSFRNVERALIYEIERQTELWLSNTPRVSSETRGWNDKKQITVEQRGKEETQDYRYFPEPDLPPLMIDAKWLEKIKGEMPELPQAKAERFIEQYEFSPDDAQILVNNKKLADYSEQVISELKAWLVALEEMAGSEEEIWQKHKKQLSQLAANWLINKLFGLLFDKKISFSQMKVTPENFAEFITLIYQNKINSRNALEILSEMLDTGADPSHILADKNLGQISDEEEIIKIIKKVTKNNPEQVKQYRSGKEALLQFFIGQVMKATRGQADPILVEKLLKQELR
ncbi:MAG: Asp-tRNA(Asn)/Glu-tRNA(Gln) amidotransferase subunit GatB [bacterium]